MGYACICEDGYVQMEDGGPCVKFTYDDLCLSGEHDCPENSKCSNLELKNGFTCNCNAGYFESPVITGHVNLTEFPNKGVGCFPVRQKIFTDYSIEYVISRYQVEYYGAKQFCLSIGEHEAKLENRVKTPWTSIVPNSAEENKWLAGLLGFDDQNYIDQRHDTESAWLGIAHKKDFGWYRLDGGPIVYNKFDQIYENREALGEFVSYDGNNAWRLYDYTTARAYTGREL